MGLTDKLKGLQQQAQATVAEHRGGIHSAVESVSNAANQRTRGKYADKIAKAGRRLTDAVDRIGPEKTGDTAAEPSAGSASTGSAPTTSAPADAASSGSPVGGPPPAGPATSEPASTEQEQDQTPPRDLA